MDRKLINYLPPILREVPTFAEITDVQQIEVEEAWDALGETENNLFVGSADDAGISLFEADYNITPASGETLDARRQAVLKVRLGKSPPTLVWLIEWFTETIGGETPTVADYTVKLIFPEETGGGYTEETALSLLRERIPANMRIVYLGKNMVNTWQNAWDKFTTWGAASEYTWEEAQMYEGAV